MNDSYVTEEQQVEEIKKWWRENGNSLVTGAALGLALVFGWRTWNEWHEGKAEAASALYQQLVGAPKADAALIQGIGTRLIDEYPNASYAIFGAFMQASAFSEKGDLASARGRLEWVLLHTTDAHLKALAELRLGRILLDQGDTERTRTLAESVATAGLPEAAELRGDFLLRQGNRAGAQQAYQESLAKLPVNSHHRAALQIKIDDLGHD